MTDSRSHPESTCRSGAPAAEEQVAESSESFASYDSGASRKSGSRRGRSRKSPVDLSAQDPTVGSFSKNSSNQHGKLAEIDPPADEAQSRYQRIAEVGRGGWGIVEKAIDRQLDREVAVKRFCNVDEVSQQERQRFFHEAKVTSQLQHPGIVPVHEMGDRGDAFYVMKLLDGITLSEFIHQQHQQHQLDNGQTRFQFGESLEPLLQRFVDVCQAVAYAHRRGVIHRDLKPSNVMISDFGETVVLDWGLAQSVEIAESDPAAAASETRRMGLADVSSVFEPDGTVIGTPAYMSPEQARGEVSRINTSSDMYSLGVVLYTIIAGHHPYRGQSVEAILEQVTIGSYRDLQLVQPLTPAPLLSIVRKAMSCSHKDRYADAQALAGDVRRFIAGDSVSVHQEAGLERMIRWCRHHQGIAATAALSVSALLIAAIVFAFFLHQSHLAERVARIEAQRAHHEAITRLSETLEATDTWLVELSGSLEFYPGMASIRSDLLERAIDQYERIARQELVLTDQVADTKRLALLERMKVHLRLGDLYRLTDKQAQAREQYALAEKLIYKQRPADLVNGAPELKVTRVASKKTEDRWETEFEIERVNALIGQLLMHDTSDQRPFPVQRVLAARRWLGQRLPRPSASSYRSDDIALPKLTARIASVAVRLEMAIREYATSHPQLEWTEQAYLDALEIARWLVNQRGTLGDRRLSENIQTDHCRRLQDTDEIELAEAGWSRLIIDLEQWIQTDPDRIDYWQSSAHALIQRGNIRVRLGRPDEAAEDFRSSISQLDQAWRLTDDDTFYRVNLATSRNNLARLLTRGNQRDPALAGQLLRQSLQTYEALLHEEVTCDILRRYAQTHAALAELAFDSAAANSSDRTVGIEHARQALDAFSILRDYQQQTPQEDVLKCEQLQRQIESQTDIRSRPKNDTNGNAKTP